jgi:hypothetical protein
LNPKLGFGSIYFDCYSFRNASPYHISYSCSPEIMNSLSGILVSLQAMSHAFRTSTHCIMLAEEHLKQ